MFDELDQKIVDTLEAYGYKKNRELAAMLKIDERTLYRRMNRLLHSGYFKVIAVCNPILLGISSVWVGIRVEPSSLIFAAYKLMEHPNVSFLAYTLGRFDILIFAQFASIGELSDFLTLELYTVPGVQTTEPMIVIGYGKYFGFHWSYIEIDKLIKNTEDNQAALIRKLRYRMDKTDEAILNLLRQDGLIRPSAIKSKLTISDVTVRKRINNMRKNNLFSLEVAVNPETSRHIIRATIGISLNKYTAQTVIDRLVKNPSVNTAYVSLGRYNIIISAHFHSTQLLNQFLTETLPSIEGISQIETFLYLKIVKRMRIIWSNPDEL